jgi:catechol 2,3-dioxygenase
MNASTAGIPRLRFSHLGLCVMDLPAMEDFYTRVLGFTVTDRGGAMNLDLVFLSRDPNDHHQLVLGTGRPHGLPQNTRNAMFGPCVNQISFALETLDELKAFDRHLSREYPGYRPMHGNHGTAWSIYFQDPEGNLLESFVDTAWYCRQPVFEPLDLSQSNAEIEARTLALAQSSPGFQPAEAWRQQIRVRMDAVTRGHA